MYGEYVALDFVFKDLTAGATKVINAKIMLCCNNICHVKLLKCFIRYQRVLDFPFLRE